MSYNVIMIYNDCPPINLKAAGHFNSQILVPLNKNNNLPLPSMGGNRRQTFGGPSSCL